MILRLGATHADGIRRHLERAYPEEGCGVLLGREGDAAREVERAIELDNLREDERERRYVISPEQFLASERAARADGLDVLGFYHSHPDHPARPSGFDLEHAWPWYSYLIASVARGRLVDLRSWRLRGDRGAFDEEPVDLPAPGDGDKR
jgi:proteasome lid subunit RPN8/RPN11